MRRLAAGRRKKPLAVCFIRGHEVRQTLRYKNAFCRRPITLHRRRRLGCFELRRCDRGTRIKEKQSSPFGTEQTAGN